MSGDLFAPRKTTVDNGRPQGAAYAAHLRGIADRTASVVDRVDLLRAANELDRLSAEATPADDQIVFTADRPPAELFFDPGDGSDPVNLTTVLARLDALEEQVRILKAGGLHGA